MTSKQKNPILTFAVLTITMSFCNMLLFGQSKTRYINPTGTYILDSKTIEKNGEVYGYTGIIQVKKLAGNKIAMTFYICKGAPSYNSGDFEDTILYDKNRAVFMDPQSAAKCTTTFVFSDKGVTISEGPKNLSGKCWGFGVVANGHFTKQSAKTPVLTDPLSGERL